MRNRKPPYLGFKRKKLSKLLKLVPPSLTIFDALTGKQLDEYSELYRLIYGRYPVLEIHLIMTPLRQVLQRPWAVVRMSGI